MNWIMAHGADVLQVIGAGVAVATLVVKLTPTPKDDEVLGKVIRFLSMISLVNPDGSVIGKKEERK